MSLWRKTADLALDHETQQHVREQREWIAREPLNAVPYYNLAQLYRMQWKPQEGLALLLEAVRLDPVYADAHAALAEMYAVSGDYRAAWRHAKLAAENGNPRGVEMLNRHGIREE
jgi:tetratricopeptide (TPR) repeat protein